MRQLHLRRVGVEARPELLQGAKIVTAANLNNFPCDATDDPAKNDQGRPAGATDRVGRSEASEDRKNDCGETSISVGDKSDVSEDLDDLFEDDRKRSLATDPGTPETHFSGEKGLNHDREHKETEPDLLGMQ